MKTGSIKLATYKLLSFDKIPSTQEYAHKIINVGRAIDHTAILAAAQSAGRGRHSRTWVSHHGNLYVSFIFNRANFDGRLAYMVGVAVATAVSSYGIDAKIKWPNDILIDDKKVSGILIEYSGNFVIVGIGVNITTNPTVNATYETTRLNNYANVDRMDLLHRIMNELDIWMNADFNTVRKKWNEMSAARNETIVWRGDTYKMIEIDADGALVLGRDDETFRVWGDEIQILSDINHQNRK